MKDALTQAGDASYEAQAARPALDAEDVELARQLIGRPLRGRSAAAVRCAWGLPAVLRVDPQLVDGSPFPTTFWLACPRANSAVGTLEASGVMADLNQRLQADAELAASYAGSAERFVAFRDALGDPVPKNPAAGGMPDRVKCLHSLYGHHLATDDNAIGAWVAERIEPLDCPEPCASLPQVQDDRRVVAAVDLGTNSTRLLVARDNGAGGLEPITRLMTITRLGEGVDATGMLSPAAIDRTVATVEGYATTWRELGAGEVRITATSAARDAGNAAQFSNAIALVAGARPEVLSGDQEAALAFRGATGGLPGVTGPCVVLDIGGGSTELIRGDGVTLASTSRQLGCVRLTERALHSDPPTADEIAHAQQVIAAELDAAAELVGPRPGDTLIGVAGTITTIAALHLGLPEYQPERIHGTRVPFDAVTTITNQLLAMTAAQRAQLGPMEAGREDVIGGGALVLQAVMERFGFSEVIASEADILDGLAWSLLELQG